MRIAIDFDGVLTDGKTFIDSNGNKVLIAVNSKDNAAIRQLIFDNWQIDIITANDSDAIKNYAFSRGCGYIYDRLKQFDGYDICIVDSMQDMKLVNRSKVVFVPCNSDTKLHYLKKVRIIPLKGGEGVINYIVQNFLIELKDLIK